MSSPGENPAVVLRSRPHGSDEPRSTRKRNYRSPPLPTLYPTWGLVSSPQVCCIMPALGPRTCEKAGTNQWE
jgi:hypothetical protein